jgi:hypothetical protein
MISRGFAPRGDHPGQYLTRLESDNSVVDEAGPGNSLPPPPFYDSDIPCPGHPDMMYESN